MVILAEIGAFSHIKLLRVDFDLGVFGHASHEQHNGEQ